MRIRLLRAFFTLTTLAVVWLVTSPALASASALASSAPAASEPPAFTSATAAASGRAATTVLLASLVSPLPPPPVPRSQKAPLCDPRGAITFAAPPQMQDLEVTLDTGLTLEDCMAASSPGSSRHAAPGRVPLPVDASASPDVAVLPAVVMLAAAARELLPVPAARTECPRPGVRSTVDRPPRA